METRQFGETDMRVGVLGFGGQLVTETEHDFYNRLEAALRT